eukprot:350742-Chlamydomonas_euryale.AAC.13
MRHATPVAPPKSAHAVSGVAHSDPSCQQAARPKSRPLESAPTTLPANKVLEAASEGRPPDPCSKLHGQSSHPGGLPLELRCSNCRRQVAQGQPPGWPANDAQGRATWHSSAGYETLVAGSSRAPAAPPAALPRVLTKPVERLAKAGAAAPAPCAAEIDANGDRRTRRAWPKEPRETRSCACCAARSPLASAASPPGMLNPRRVSNDAICLQRLNCPPLLPLPPLLLLRRRCRAQAGSTRSSVGGSRGLQHTAVASRAGSGGGGGDGLPHGAAAEAT